MTGNVSLLIQQGWHIGLRGPEVLHSHLNDSFQTSADLPHFIILLLVCFMKMPCIGQSECHVAPPLQPLPNSHLHMNLLHSTELDI